MTWVAVVICVLGACLFSGMEAGILSVNRVRLRHRVKLREPAALVLDGLLAQPERVLVTVLIVSNLMSITAVVLSTEKLVLRFGATGYLVSGAIWLPVYLLVIELLPKSLFRRFPYRALAALSGLLRAADRVLGPILDMGARLMRVVFPRGNPAGKKLFCGREDFKYLTVESERQGTLTKQEREMIHNVVDFRTITARDVMTPVREIEAVHGDMPVSALLEMTKKMGADRVPLASKTGEITGMVNVMDVLLDPARSSTIAAFQRRLVSVNADESASSVMRKLRAARIRLALVQDQAGQPLGFVSSEDLIQKLVKPAVVDKK